MSGSVFQVPFTGIPETFTVSLAGTTYTLTVHWNIPGDCWILDIGDTTGTLIDGGIPLVTGADLLEQYGYLGIDGKLIVQTANDPTAVPTFTNLGTLGNLYFLPVAA